MAGGLDWLLKLDSIADRPGDGLHPKLAELLRDRRETASPDVIQLPAAYASSGLEVQTYNSDDLEAAGIPVIGEKTPAEAPPIPQRTESKDGKSV
ncbi:MAG: hypothetical protein AAF666_10460 [Pseudomonadota bacterium]